VTPLEKDIEKALGRMIGRRGGLCLKWICPGWAGVPDRIVLLPGGRVIFVELKRPKGGVMSSRQKWWSDKLNKLGFFHLWIQNHSDILALEQVLTVWDAEVRADG
jgi:hypothetical protein